MDTPIFDQVEADTGIQLYDPDFYFEELEELGKRFSLEFAGDTAYPNEYSVAPFLGQRDNATQTLRNRLRNVNTVQKISLFKDDLTPKTEDEILTESVSIRKMARDVLTFNKEEEDPS